MHLSLPLVLPLTEWLSFWPKNIAYRQHHMRIPVLIQSPYNNCRRWTKTRHGSDHTSARKLFNTLFPLLAYDRHALAMNKFDSADFFRCPLRGFCRKSSPTQPPSSTSSFWVTECVAIWNHRLPQNTHMHTHFSRPRFRRRRHSRFTCLLARKFPTISVHHVIISGWPQSPSTTTTVTVTRAFYTDC